MENRKLTKAERKDRHNRKLCELVKQNDLRAQTELLLENEGLIVQLGKSLEIAHELDINHYGGIELDDILQEGASPCSKRPRNMTYTPKRNSRHMPIPLCAMP